MKPIKGLLFSVLLVIGNTLLFINLQSCGPKNNEKSWVTDFDTVIAYSSPHCADLNADGVEDIVVGAGDYVNGGQVVAVNGKDGKRLWKAVCKGAIWGSALFYDVTKDGTPDVFIGGDNAVFIGIDGKSGAILWHFYNPAETAEPSTKGWFGFYSAQLVPDQNNDGFKDIVVSNGGDPQKAALDTVRPAGHLLVLDSKTGKILGQIETPDSRETYCSPVVVDFEGNGKTHILWGTGGETIRGSLWKVKLEDVMKGNKDSAIAIVSSEKKGFISPPTLAKINSDNVWDIVVNSFEGNTMVINGKNNKLAWRSMELGYETYASPTIGYFTDDRKPDVFITQGKGKYPTYTEWKHFAYNGFDGSPVFAEGILFDGRHTPSAIAFDYNSDGTDEIVYIDNMMDEDNLFYHDLIIYDFKNQQKTKVKEHQAGLVITNTPYVGDMDKDGNADLVYVYMRNKPKKGTNENFIEGWTIERVDLGVKAPAKFSWKAYMGNDYDGYFDK